MVTFHLSSPVYSYWYQKSPTVIPLFPIIMGSTVAAQRETRNVHGEDACGTAENPRDRDAGQVQDLSSIFHCTAKVFPHFPINTEPLRDSRDGPRRNRSSGNVVPSASRLQCVLWCDILAAAKNYSRARTHLQRASRCTCNTIAC